MGNMGRYHNLFYTLFATGGIVYFSIFLFQGVIVHTFPQSESVMMTVTRIPGMILFILAIILVSAIIFCGAKKIYAFLCLGSEKILTFVKKE